MANTETLERFFSYVDQNQEHYVTRLREAVAIPRYIDNFSEFGYK